MLGVTSYCYWASTGPGHRHLSVGSYNVVVWDERSVGCQRLLHLKHSNIPPLTEGLQPWTWWSSSRIRALSWRLFARASLTTHKAASEVFETQFFRFLGSRGILKELAQSYPTPRQKHEVPLWMYLGSNLFNAPARGAPLPCLSLRGALLAAALESLVPR
ncbi:hypothetical protein HKBW3S06_00999 [Candidatus Hakubella thermalkaliphila]|uniref:Uncharacterized protein n=1 Tax=Candidatus Hakubella thermalkaliphila TaxID=2754717 RepID=A0A6V8NN57_9ACTN|nr:hypothetical protein HKBW3S06_00999 [Candidatus Hakubella thermalkaliphila]